MPGRVLGFCAGPGWLPEFSKALVAKNEKKSLGDGFVWVWVSVSVWVRGGVVSGLSAKIEKKWFGFRFKFTSRLGFGCNLQFDCKAPVIFAGLVAKNERKLMGDGFLSGSGFRLRFGSGVGLFLV